MTEYSGAKAPKDPPKAFVDEWRKTYRCHEHKAGLCNDEIRESWNSDGTDGLEEGHFFRAGQRAQAEATLKILADALHEDGCACSACGKLHMIAAAIRAAAPKEGE